MASPIAEMQFMDQALRIRPTTIEEAQEQCLQRGWKITPDRGVGGADERIIIVFVSHGTAGRCFYNATKGHFCGVTHRGERFNSDDSAFFRVHWFRDLMALLLMRDAGLALDPGCITTPASMTDHSFALQSA